MPLSTLCSGTPLHRQKLRSAHHLLLYSKLAPSGISSKSFFTLQQFLQVNEESEVVGHEHVGYVSMKLNTETASANLRERLWCVNDQHSILLNEPHNLAGLSPTSISISFINRRHNNSNFLYIMQPLIVPDQVLAPRGYSFCSIGNHAYTRCKNFHQLMLNAAGSPEGMYGDR